MARVILGSRPAKVFAAKRGFIMHWIWEECANLLAFGTLLPHSLEVFLEFLRLPEQHTQASYINF